MSDATGAAPDAGVQFEGRIDAIEAAAAYGWAWDRRRPGDRLDVQIWLGDVLLGASRADRPRGDLEAMGAGDGAHAFEVPLRQPVDPARRREIVARLRSPSTGVGAVMAQPAATGGADPVRRLAELLEAVAEGQHRLFAGQQAGFRDLSAAIERLSPQLDRSRLDAACAALAAVQTAIEQKLAAVEQVQARCDEALAKLDAAPAPAATQRRRRRAGPGAILAVLLVAAVAWLLAGNLDLRAPGPIDGVLGQAVSRLGLWSFLQGRMVP